MLVRVLAALVTAAVIGLPVAAEETGLREQAVAVDIEGQPILWRDFGAGQPASAIRVVKEDEAEVRLGQPRAQSAWIVRRPGWTPALLNAVGTPPEISFDPRIREECDIFLGLRAVDPVMTFDIKLSGDSEFTTITAPAATPARHFDFEFHWRARTAMVGQKIAVRARGKPMYLQYIKFVPHRQTSVIRRVPKERLTILQEKGRHFAFPGVAQLADGSLLVVCREGDGHVCARGRIVATRSSDGGKTWSPRQVVHDSPSDDRDPAVLCLKDGTVVASFCTWDSWRDSPGLREKYPTETARMEKDGWGMYSGIWTSVSTDHGRTWSPPRRAPEFFSPHGPVPGPDGALYWAAVGSGDGRTAVVIHRTADLGRSWQRWTEVAYSRPYDPSNVWEYWDEPNLLFLPGRRALATFRVEMDGLVWQSHSADQGKTWSWPARTPVWGFPQQLCLLGDGRVLMAYGYRKPPLGVRACVSSDGGRNYDSDREIILRHDGDNIDLGYPYSIQLRDGRVLTVYYFVRKGTDCYIEGAIYRP